MLNGKEYDHSLSTGLTAGKLALENGEDPLRARVAGYLHDCARNLSPGELLVKAEKFNLQVSPEEKNNPYLLHAPVGAVIAAREFGVEDELVLMGIASHTTGRPGMTLFEKIIYLADIIEPGRDYDGVESLRNLASEDIERAFNEAYLRTVEYVKANGYELHPVTIEVLREIKERG